MSPSSPDFSNILRGNSPAMSSTVIIDSEQILTMKNALIIQKEMIL